MEFTNEFVVPAAPEEAWALLTDVPRIAPCMPGASVTPKDDGSYEGTVTVKVGPIKVSYGGTAAFRERDADKRRMVLDAGGSESSGKGSAEAVVTVDLVADGSDKTRVLVGTQLRITGKVAQFGRSAMADVGARIIGQFATNLEGLLTREQPAGAPGQQTPAAAAPAAAATADVPSAGSELNALAFVWPIARRYAPTAGAFVGGVLATWLVTRLRGRPAPAAPALPVGQP
ncbi:SRPBCC family protein [Streptomyces sp. SID10853]|uniref:SRPBCC family protein n=1 Tax=Streptomyces sp. SID10853 TaxID=2706028 RepID=UPI0013C0790A|nr:SRPBCC family protein [Streptomyces sp. SID10853]NDZ78276.1 SRPBCC family protein [Streptomyces sp. SID10853]